MRRRLQMELGPLLIFSDDHVEFAFVMEVPYRERNVMRGRRYQEQIDSFYWRVSGMNDPDLTVYPVPPYNGYRTCIYGGRMSRR